MLSMQEEVEDSFVSINLETIECGICGLDTGESLTSCHLCSNKPITKGPIQMGFNQLPDVLHSGMTAHESCLAQAHQVVRQDRALSPHLHRRGCSVPNDFPALGPRETIGDRLQWLVNYAKNEDVKNRNNLLQVHSSPCTRSSSPVTFKKEHSESDIFRQNSENNLNSDPGSQELRKSYTKYLYGLTQSRSDDSALCKTGSFDSIVTDTHYKLLSRNITMPDAGKVKGQTMSPREDTKKGRVFESETERYGPNLTPDNNKTDLTDGPKSGSEKLYITVSPNDEEMEKGDVGSETQRWSEKQKMNKEQLKKMSAAEIKKLVSSLGNIIKEISAELVDLLQERDSLDQEVKVRNLTIQKLVKMKHQQEAPIKTTGVGNI